MTRVVAVFESPMAVERAIDAARQAGWRAVSVCSPAFDEALLQQVGATESPVAAYALMGGVVGTISGFALTIGTVRQWPGLIVGGKPLVAGPTVVIIAFELAILFAAIGAVVSFLVAAKRARRTAQGLCSPDTTDARFALLLESAARHAELDRLIGVLRPVEWRSPRPPCECNS